jgi:hypothetical protein
MHPQTITEATIVLSNPCFDTMGKNDNKKHPIIQKKQQKTRRNPKGPSQCLKESVIVVAKLDTNLERVIQRIQFQKMNELSTMPNQKKNFMSMPTIKNQQIIRK